MRTINKEWHLAYKMPQNSTLEKRVVWHIDHFKNYKCGKMPQNVYETTIKEAVCNDY